MGPLGQSGRGEMGFDRVGKRALTPSVALNHTATAALAPLTHERVCNPASSGSKRLPYRGTLAHQAEEDCEYSGMPWCPCKAIASDGTSWAVVENDGSSPRMVEKPSAQRELTQDNPQHPQQRGSLPGKGQGKAQDEAE